ncbi:hypothetical protein CMQ_7685 [Grosmannia clavigera kw1407]|uniref:Uncharacterized protein n=1 Tax=Grosmannia clavigera (strain kw1407 / UAMH 11150) TaxID=655863 RepID=F0XQD0_GROCL|nr:uncharacterized protein CMQ_7685 [Grosmannia clavigera kw1407]EFX00683.1 hypothetical protein CMQ_7685 [Grosmannia clavigera kw1407]
MAPRKSQKGKKQPSTPSPAASPTLSPESQLPLAQSPIIGLAMTSTPGQLLPKIKAGLTVKQIETIAELERKYLLKKGQKKSAPLVPNSTQPGRLSSQRPIDGPNMLSLKLAEFQAGLDLTEEIG